MSSRQSPACHDATAAREERSIDRSPLSPSSAESDPHSCQSSCARPRRVATFLGQNAARIAPRHSTARERGTVKGRSKDGRRTVEERSTNGRRTDGRRTVEGWSKDGRRMVEGEWPNSKRIRWPACFFALHYITRYTPLHYITLHMNSKRTSCPACFSSARAFSAFCHQRARLDVFRCSQSQR